MRKLKDLAETCIYAADRISKRFEADNLTAYAAQGPSLFLSLFSPL